jgi:hypothetical protein
MGASLDIETETRAVDSPALRVREDKVGEKKKWYYYVWDTLDKPKEERWFMFKLDAALLTFASLGTSLRTCNAHWGLLIRSRILHQVPRPVQHQQRFRLGNVSDRAIAVVRC